MSLQIAILHHLPAAMVIADYIKRDRRRIQILCNLLRCSRALYESTNVKHMMSGMRLTSGEAQKIALTRLEHVAVQIILKHASAIIIAPTTPYGGRLVNICSSLRVLICAPPMADLSALIEHTDLQVLVVRVRLPTTTPEECSSFFAPIAMLTNLRKLSVSSNIPLSDITRLPTTIRKLGMSANCSLAHLTRLTDLDSLNLFIWPTDSINSTNQIDLAVIESLTCLKRLSLDARFNNRQSYNLPRLPSQLEYLELRGQTRQSNCFVFASNENMDTLTSLKSIVLSRRQNIADDVNIISACRSLQEVNLAGVFASEIALLSEIDTMHKLTISNCRSLAGIARFRYLQILYIMSTSDLNLTPLGQNDAIHTLTLRSCAEPTGLSALCTCRSLRSVALFTCRGTIDVLDLRDAVNLCDITITRCPRVVGVDELERHSNATIRYTPIE